MSDDVRVNGKLLVEVAAQVAAIEERTKRLPAWCDDTQNALAATASRAAQAQHDATEARHAIAGLTNRVWSILLIVVTLLIRELYVLLMRGANAP